MTNLLQENGWKPSRLGNALPHLLLYFSRLFLRLLFVLLDLVLVHRDGDVDFVAGPSGRDAEPAQIKPQTNHAGHEQDENGEQAAHEEPSFQNRLFRSPSERRRREASPTEPPAAGRLGRWGRSPNCARRANLERRPRAAGPE